MERRAGQSAKVRHFRGGFIGHFKLSGYELLSTSAVVIPKEPLVDALFVARFTMSAQLLFTITARQRMTAQRWQRLAERMTAAGSSMPTTAQAAPRAALITGGGRRIGRAIALALAQRGLRGGAACQSLARRGRRARGRDRRRRRARRGGAGRSRRHDAVRGLVPAAAAFGPLTLLVNNAGEFEPDEIGSLERARFERTLAVNLRRRCSWRRPSPRRRRRAPMPRSSICVDQRVLKPTPRFLSYTLSKSALHTATTTLAQALAPKLRVNAVAPGPTLPSPRQTRRAIRRARRRRCRSSAGRRREDIAAAVLYLAQAHKRHRRDHRGRRRPASRLAHRRQRRRGIARIDPCASLSFLPMNGTPKDIDPASELREEDEEPTLPELELNERAGRHARRRPRRDRARRQARAVGARRLSHDRCARARCSTSARRRTSRSASPPIRGRPATTAASPA